MTNVVIIGGGYTGFEAQKKLFKTLGRHAKEVCVTVINRDEYHTFHGWTGEVLGGLIPLQLTLTNLALHMPKANFLRGTVVHVDVHSRAVTVHTEDGDRVLSYDHLVVGTGSRDPFERIPGLAEYGWCLKNTQDMQRFRTYLAELLRALEEAPQALRENIVIAGGGFAGVEMASALEELMRVSKRHSNLGRHEVRVHLVTGKRPLLNELREQGYQRLAQFAERQLERRGIQLHRATCVNEITSQGAHLSNGAFLPARTVLVAAGISFRPLPGLEDLYEDGRLPTDEFMRIRGQTNLWAGGDIARVEQPQAGRTCPVNALWAMKHGLHAGKNIGRSILGKPLRPFAFRGLGQSASLGVGVGITELHGVQFTGLLAWLVRLGFFVWYMPSKRDGFKVATHWLCLPWKGRELPERDVKERAPLGGAKEAVTH